VTEHPIGRWVTQQARNLAAVLEEEDRPVTFLIRDRDTKFVGPFDEVMSSIGARVIKTPVRAPQAKGLASHCTSWWWCLQKPTAADPRTGLLPGGTQAGRSDLPGRGRRCRRGIGPWRGRASLHRWESACRDGVVRIRLVARDGRQHHVAYDAPGPSSSVLAAGEGWDQPIPRVLGRLWRVGLRNVSCRGRSNGCSSRRILSESSSKDCSPRC
jgi:hypothetical protein